VTAELVPVENMADIEALAPADREVAVTHMLAEARSWLAHAVETTGPQRIAEFKAWVATVAETTRQLQLSKEIQLDALEMVRRAERGVGLAIRKGQADGQIRKPTDNLRQSEVAVGNFGVASPTDFATKHELTNTHGGIYDITDDVTDEQFDAAIEQAKAEENLSRANVIRKARNQDRPTGDRHELLRGTRRPDANRIVEQTVISLEGLCIGLQLLDHARLDPEKIPAWSSSLKQSLRSFNQLLKELNQA
jgi:hypothetical protein